jgi:outer membrane receptor protein involved in Fe transport
MRLTLLRFYVLFLCFVLVSNTFASSGKLTGKIIDKDTGEALPFVNVMIEGTTMGAATDINGVFTILNVPPGVYNVTASLVGYLKSTIKDVRVNVDFTTRLDFQLSSGSIDLPAVIVQGERNPLIRQDLTNPTVAITSETIGELPVDQISDIIKLQAGVAVGNDGELHFRGGYANEVAYTINGVSVNDPYGNSRSVGIATNAVQEVSVSTGTFSAEYGNALSGVVNYVTKEGGEKYTFSLRGYGGDYLTTRTDLFKHLDKIDPLNRGRVEGTFGGTVPFTNRNMKFFFSGVYENFKGHLYGDRLYKTTDSYLALNEFPTGNPRKGNSTAAWFFNPYDTLSTGLPTGDGETVALNDNWSLNLQGNISYNFTSLLKLKYEFVLDRGESHGGGNFGSYESRYNPDGMGKTYDNSVHNAVEFTHTVSSNVFYTIKGSYTFNRGQYYLYEDPFDSRYLPTAYQRRLGNSTFLTGGTDNYRFSRSTETMGIKGDLVAQMFETHEVKFGFEGRFFDLNVESYSVEIGKLDPSATDGFGTLTTSDLLNPNTVYVRRVPTSPSLYTKYSRKPSSFAVYLRDKIELESSLILNAGVRYEYFNPNAYYNDNLTTELQDEKSGYMSRNLKKATVKHMVSPRISISYPITEKGLIRFSYGHFYQNGSLSSLYSNPNFWVTNAGSTPSFGNPDVNPQKSIQYELGLNQVLTDDLKLEVTGFYKDVSDYIYTQTVYTTQGREYSVLTNLAYSNVRGVTISLFKRRSPQSLFQASLDYTFQIAEGSRTEPSEDLFFSEASGKLTETYLVPLAFDRPHILNASVNLIEPDNWTMGLVANLQLGTPYTPSLPASLVPITYNQNSARRPMQFNLDFKFEKFFSLGNIKYSVFLQIDNILDIENEISVYASSGRALSNVEQTLNSYEFKDLKNRILRGDPGLVSYDEINNYYGNRPQNVNRPREVRVGFSVVFN